MRSTWYATYVCNVKSISMTVEKWSVQSVHFRVIKRETRWGRGQGRAGQGRPVLLCWIEQEGASDLHFYIIGVLSTILTNFYHFPNFYRGLDRARDVTLHHLKLVQQNINRYKWPDSSCKGACKEIVKFRCIYLVMWPHSWPQDFFFFMQKYSNQGISCKYIQIRVFYAEILVRYRYALPSHARLTIWIGPNQTKPNSTRMAECPAAVKTL